MSVDPHVFRSIMRAWASGVSVVTTSDGQERAGLTVNAFTSLSLSPALALICINCHSSSLAVIQRSGVFAINILAEDQADISQRFASSRTQDRFAEALWTTHTTGAPILTSALAWLDCTLSGSYDGGDHLILIGTVVATGTNPARDLGPLLYYGGAYQLIEKAVLAYDV